MAKPNKTKLPKTVAGVKVPKALRKSGILVTMIGSPSGRKLVADALVAAGVAAAAVLAKAALAPAGSGKAAKRDEGESALAEAAHQAAGSISAILTAAAAALHPTLGAAPSEGGEGSQESQPDEPASPPRRRNRTRRQDNSPDGAGQASGSANQA